MTPPRTPHLRRLVVTACATAAVMGLALPAHAAEDVPVTDVAVVVDDALPADASAATVAEPEPALIAADPADAQPVAVTATELSQTGPAPLAPLGWAAGLLAAGGALLARRGLGVTRATRA